MTIDANKCIGEKWCQQLIGKCSSSVCKTKKRMIHQTGAYYTPIQLDTGRDFASCERWHTPANMWYCWILNFEIDTVTKNK